MDQVARPTRHIPVLIVGGGPVGLALAAELGWRGVACELVEQGDGKISTPKMNEVNTRTMEFCRRWGIAETVRNCPFPGDYPLDVVFVTSLSGHELARMRRPPRGTRPSGKDSPEQHADLLADLVRSDPAARLRARSPPSRCAIVRGLSHSKHRRRRHRRTARP